MKKFLLLAAAALVAFTFSSCSKDEESGTPAKYGNCTIEFVLKYRPDLTNNAAHSPIPSGNTVKATISKDQLKPAREKDYVQYYNVGKDGKVTINIKSPYIYTDMKEFTVKLEMGAIIHNIKKNAQGDKVTHKFIWTKSDVKVVAGEKFNIGEYLVSGSEYNPAGTI